MVMSLVLAAASGLVLSTKVGTNARAAVRMGVIDEYAISRVVKEVRIFDGDYASEIQDVITEVAEDCIAEQGSFSIAIPGGSVVAAFAGISSEALDFSKVHIFLCNEKIPSYPCLEGALEAAEKLGVPKEQVYGFGEGSPAEVAAKYTDLLKSHPSVDNSGTIPSLDMMLLGTGGDGHCGCLFPESAEIKATGLGEVVLAGNDERADGDFVAVSMDVMNAAKTVIVSAAGSGRAPMVAKALSGSFGLYDCPAGMVDAQDTTFWFTDKEGIADFKPEEFDDDDDDDDE